jgi:hypothetical protein
LAEDALRVAGADGHPLRSLALAEASRGCLIGPYICLQSIDAQDHGARLTVMAWVYRAAHSYWVEDEVTLFEGYSRALELAEEQGDIYATPTMHQVLAYLMFAYGSRSPREALHHAEQSIAAARPRGDASLLAGGLIARGAALLYAGRPAEAMVSLHEGLALGEEINSFWHQGLGAFSPWRRPSSRTARGRLPLPDNNSGTRSMAAP